MLTTTNLDIKTPLFYLVRGIHTFLSYWSRYSITPKPAVMYLELTYRCTLKCSFCDRWIIGPPMRERELKLEEIKVLLNDAAKIGVRYLGLTGGEAFLRPEIFEIGQFAKSLGMKVTVASNGTLISERTIREVKKSFDSITISVDGASKETHDKLRGVPGAFDKAMNALDLFKKWHIPTAVNMVVHNQNFKEVDDYFQLFSKKGIRVQLTPVHDSSTSYFNVKENLKKIDMKEFNEEWARLSQKYKFLRRGYYRNLPVFLSSPKEVHGAYTCFAGTAVFFVSPLGDVSPCEFLRKKMGNIREKSLVTIWKEAKELRRLISSPKRPCVCWVHCAVPMNSKLTTFVALKKQYSEK